MNAGPKTAGAQAVKTAQTAEGTREIRRDPVVAAAPARSWRRWGRGLLETAGGRLAGAPLLLVGAFLVEAAALYSFGRLADAVAEAEGGIPRVDAAVLEWLTERSSPALDQAAFVASALGAEAIMPLLVGSIAVFAWQRRWGSVVSMVVVTIGAQHLDTVLKGSFRRVRPNPISSPLLELMPDQAFSFPSGHAMVAAAFYLFLAYVVWRVLKGPGRVVAVSGLVALVLAVGWSRLYLGVHYLTDVLAGFAAGASWAGVVVGAGLMLAVPRRRAGAAPRGRVTGLV